MVFSRWVVHLFDIHSFHNAYIGSEKPHPVLGNNSVINISLRDTEDPNAVNIMEFVVSEAFFYKTDLDAVRILRQRLSNINPVRSRIHGKFPVNPQLSNIQAPLNLSLNDKLYKFYGDLSYELRGTAIHWIVSILYLSKIDVDEISRQSILRVSSFSEMIKNFEHVPVSDFSEDPLYVSMLDELFYVQKFLQRVIQQRYILNSDLPDSPSVHESVDEVYKILIKHDPVRRELIEECGRYVILSR